MSLDALEFLRRFALHVLPHGFMRIRHYGLLANRSKAALLARAPAPPESVLAFWQRIAGLDIMRCPHCHRGTLRLLAVLAPQPQPPP